MWREKKEVSKKEKKARHSGFFVRTLRQAPLRPFLGSDFRVTKSNLFHFQSYFSELSTIQLSTIY